MCDPSSGAPIKVNGTMLGLWQDSLLHHGSAVREEPERFSNGAKVPVNDAVCVNVGISAIMTQEYQGQSLHHDDVSTLSSSLKLGESLRLPQTMPPASL